MRIVDRKTFLELPAGTVYQKFEPHIRGEICIKDETAGTTDFWHVNPSEAWPADCHDSMAYFGRLDEMLKGGESGDMDFETVARDGLFDDDQLFMVWDRYDVMRLVSRLNKVLLDG